MSGHADTLREYADRTTGYIYSDEVAVLRAAADELDRAEDEIQRLRDALEQIASANLAAMYGPPIPRLQEIAKAALAAVRVEDER